MFALFSLFLTLPNDRKSPVFRDAEPLQPFGSVRTRGIHGSGRRRYDALEWNLREGQSCQVTGVRGFLQGTVPSAFISDSHLLPPCRQVGKDGRKKFKKIEIKEKTRWPSSTYCLCSPTAPQPPPMFLPFKDILWPLCSSAGRLVQVTKSLAHLLPPGIWREWDGLPRLSSARVAVALRARVGTKVASPLSPAFIGLVPWRGWWCLLLATLGHCLTECGLHHNSKAHKLKQDGGWLSKQYECLKKKKKKKREIPLHV